MNNVDMSSNVENGSVCFLKPLTDKEIKYVNGGESYTLTFLYSSDGSTCSNSQADGQNFYKYIDQYGKVWTHSWRASF